MRPGRGWRPGLPVRDRFPGGLPPLWGCGRQRGPLRGARSTRGEALCCGGEADYRSRRAPRGRREGGGSAAARGMPGLVVRAGGGRVCGGGHLATRMAGEGSSPCLGCHGPVLRDAKICGYNADKWLGRSTTIGKRCFNKAYGSRQYLLQRTQNQRVALYQVTEIVIVKSMDTAKNT